MSTSTSMKVHSIRISLEALGEPELFIEVEDPAWLTEADLFPSGNKKMVDGLALAKSLILAWNLPYPRRHAKAGEPMPLPADDAEVMRYVPIGVARHLQTVVQEAMQIPPAKRSSSSPS